MIQKMESIPPALSDSFHADVERAIFNMNRAFDPLHKDCLLNFQITGARNGYVQLVIAMPEGMSQAFVSMLQSLSGFFRFVDLKARVAKLEAKPIDCQEIERGQQLHEDFRARVCSLFDQFRGQGLEVKEAVKRTNSALKAEGNPWASYSVVSDLLREAGRFRKGR